MDFLVRVGDGRECLDGEDSMRQENGDAEQMGQGAVAKQERRAFLHT